MKKRLRLKIFLSALFFPLLLSGQCNTDEFLDTCASNLGTYNYIKSFNISATNKRKRKDTEYSYVLSKGSTYLLLVCNQNLIGGRMDLDLYDRNHKFVASTYDDNSKTNYTELVFHCTATGVYYIKPTFEGVKGGCSLCILGYSKD